MPLFTLGELYDYAEAQEKAWEAAELRKELLPIWIMHTVTKALSGETATSFEELLAKVNAEEQPERDTARDTEQIMADFAGIIAADRNKGGGEA